MKDKPTIAIAPEGEYQFITAGKEYKIKLWENDSLFCINADNGFEIYCLDKECAHLRGKDWILK